MLFQGHRMTLYWFALLTIFFLSIVGLLTAKLWQLKFRLIERERESAPFRVLWKNFPGIVVEISVDGTILNATSGCEIYGDTQFLLGKRIEDLLEVDTAKIFNDCLAQVKKTGERVDYQLHVRRQSGEKTLFHNQLVPLYGHELSQQRESDRASSFLVISSDITELERVQSELRSQKDIAEMASAAKGRFLANMTHEIRTPLNGMLGMLTMLESTDLNNQQRSFLSTLQQASDHLLAIVNDVLDLSKIESGHLELRVDQFDLPELAHRVVGIVHSRAAEKRIALQLFIEDDVPQEVISDPLRLSQILINFLTNAIKFTNNGHVILRISSKVQEEVTRIHFAVEDTGIGIDSVRAKKLFEEYSMAHGQLSVSNGGTGLGLNICKRLVEAMEGHIGVTSTPEVGSCFWFDLPMSVASLSNNLNEELPTLYPERTLWVADSFAVNRTFVVSLARKLGMSVKSFDRLRDLLGALEQEGPDVLVMSRRFFMAPDMQMKLNLVDSKTRLAVSCDEALSDGWQAPEKIVHASWAWPVDHRRLLSVFEQLLNDVDLPATPIMPNNIAQVRASQKNGLEGGALQLNVLLVEDNLVNQRVVEQILKKQGCNVSTLSSGELVQEYLLTHSTPDVILMDRHMPGMSGLEATQRVRADARWQHLPIIALSADALSEQREEFLKAGASEYLTKPVQPDDLRRALCQVKTEHRHAG